MQIIYTSGVYNFTFGRKSITAIEFDDLGYDWVFTTLALIRSFDYLINLGNFNPNYPSYMRLFWFFIFFSIFESETRGCSHINFRSRKPVIDFLIQWSVRNPKMTSQNADAGNIEMNVSALSKTQGEHF